MEILKKAFSCWDKLSDSEKEYLTRNTSLAKYKRGENIYNGDNECVGVLIIKSGELRTYILSDEGKEVTLYRLQNGDICILSASCILKNITFDVHIDAEVDSEILLVNSSVFSKLMSENIYVENFSLKTVVDRFSNVMWAMEQILFMSFDQRLATFLFDESVKNNSNIITLTHEQIAKYMGSAREVVSRMLKFFVAEGIVCLSRGGVTILDKGKLRKIAASE